MHSDFAEDNRGFIKGSEKDNGRRGGGKARQSEERTTEGNKETT